MPGALRDTDQSTLVLVRGQVACTCLRCNEAHQFDLALVSAGQERLLVYDITLAEGFHRWGQIGFPHDENGGYESSLWSSRWTIASSLVERSVIMDRHVFSVTQNLIKVNHPETDLVTIPIGY